MPLWGTTASSADNKPKYLVDDEDSDYNRENSYATDGGWVMRAGTPANGNDNADADPEILVAIGELADKLHFSSLYYCYLCNPIIHILC